MPMELVYVSIITSIFGLIGLIYLSYRKDIRSEKAFNNTLALREQKSDHERKLLKLKNKYKNPTKKKTEVEDLIKKYGPALLGNAEEEIDEDLEEESLTDRVISDLMGNKKVRDIGKKLLNSALKENKSEDNLNIIR